MRPRARRIARQEGLRHGDHGHDVHFELAAQLVEIEELDRRADADAGVVDEPRESGVADGGLDVLRSGLDRGRSR